jgi:signal transduction histidine kinase
MEGPERSSEAELKRGMEDLLHAAEDAVWAELDGDRQRLRAVLQEREEERRRWARELHDETLQQLGALQVLLTSARRSAGSGPSADVGRLLESVDVGVDLLAGQIASLRHLITELRPAALDELGLRAPLHALAERTEALTGIRVSVEVSLRYADGEITTRLLPDIELAVYRVVQEALTNAGRHSGAQRAWVSVLERDGEVTVEVGDDGAGMADGSRSGAGFGVRGMKERARLAGGRLDVLSVNRAQPPGAASQTSGTVVRMVVPATHRPPELWTGDTWLE